MMLPLSLDPLLMEVVISLVIRQTLCPLSLQKVSQNPCDSLREVVYVDVLSTGQDKMSRWDESLPAFLMARREYDICLYR
jgi:hypothetical protein